MKNLPELEVNKGQERDNNWCQKTTHTLVLANFLATPEEIKTNIYENLQTVEQQDQFEEQNAQSLGTGEIVSSQSQDTFCRQIFHISFSKSRIVNG